MIYFLTFFPKFGLKFFQSLTISPDGHTFWFRNHYTNVRWYKEIYSIREAQFAQPLLNNCSKLSSKTFASEVTVRIRMSFRHQRNKCQYYRIFASFITDHYYVWDFVWNADSSLSNSINTGQRVRASFIPFYTYVRELVPSSPNVWRSETQKYFLSRAVIYFKTAMWV